VSNNIIKLKFLSLIFPLLFHNVFEVKVKKLEKIKLQVIRILKGLLI